MPDFGATGILRNVSAIITGRQWLPAAHVAKPFAWLAPKKALMKASVSLSTLFAAVPAFAQGAESARIALPFGGGSIGAFEVIQFSMFLGVMGAALLSAGWLIRERSRVAAENKELRSKFADLNLVAPAIGRGA